MLPIHVDQNNVGRRMFGLSRWSIAIITLITFAIFIILLIEHPFDDSDSSLEEADQSMHILHSTPSSMQDQAQIRELNEQISALHERVLKLESENKLNAHRLLSTNPTSTSTVHAVADDNTAESVTDIHIPSLALIECYSLTFNIFGTGDAIFDPPQSAGCLKGTFLRGEIITLIAAPREPLGAWTFDRWTATGINSNGKHIDVIPLRGDSMTGMQSKLIMPNGRMELSAKFVRCFSLQIESGQAVTRSIDSVGSCTKFTYPAGTQITLSAHPMTRYAFQGWNEKGSRSSNESTLSVSVPSDDIVILAEYARCFSVVISVTRSKNVKGEFSQSSASSSRCQGTNTYLTGTIVTLTAIDTSAESVFVGWYQGIYDIRAPSQSFIISNVSTFDITVGTSDMIYTPMMAGCLQLTVIINIGSVSATMGNVTMHNLVSMSPKRTYGCGIGTKFITGTQVQLSASPPAGYGFIGWSLSIPQPVQWNKLNDFNSVNITVTMPEIDATIKAMFGPCFPLPLQISGKGGNVTVFPLNTPGCQLYEFTSGYPLTLMVNTSNGYELASWTTRAQGVISLASRLSFTMPTEQILTSGYWIKAVFKPICYHVSIDYQKIGRITMSTSAYGCQNSFFFGDEIVTMQAFPPNGYSFTGWTGTLVSGIDNPLSFNMPGINVRGYYPTVGASFTPICYPLSITRPPSSQGILTVSVSKYECASATFFANETIRLTAHAAKGFTFAGWSGSMSLQSQLSNTANPTTFIMPPSNDQAIGAIFV
jgi:hypothetical protein